MKKSKHANIPLFIPHEGCPHTCVFCNQRTITGESARADRDIRPAIERALATVDPAVTGIEIAFFGGSFTGIDRAVMTRLLDTAYTYVKSGRVSAIRLSTRPDYIDTDVLTVLKDRGVSAIELGIQSTDEKVLSACRRGHTASDTERACKLIRDFGFTLGGQMMIGLPGADAFSEERTARDIVRFGCKEARLYPTVVFRDTALCGMAKEGLYTPLSVEDAVKRTLPAYRILLENGINVLRIGLQSGESLTEGDAVYPDATYYHSAVGELVESAYYYDLVCRAGERIRALCKENGGILTVLCAPGEPSKVAGHGGQNRQKLLAFAEENSIPLRRVCIREDKDVAPHTLSFR